MGKSKKPATKQLALPLKGSPAKPKPQKAKRGKGTSKPSMHASQVLAPPLKWHGGKRYLAGRIIALMSPHKHYVEPFFGGGAVLLAKDPEGVSEVVNDAYGELTHFWRVLQDPRQFAEFIRHMQAVPFSEREWEDAGVPVAGEPPWHRAARFFIRCRMSYAGRMQEFTALTRSRTRRGMNAEMSAWKSAIEGLPEIHERLGRVVILNRDALDVIRQQDGEATFFYVDPPYLHETRASPDVYKHELGAEQHQRLLDTLAELEGRFALSGYRSELYDHAAKQHGWRRVDFEIPNHAAGGSTKKRMTESVWLNY